MPGEVQVKRGSEIDAPSGSQTDGMIRMKAITDLSGQFCRTVMIAKPSTASAVHHHGEEDSTIYAANGHGSTVSGFALILAFAKYQKIITRGGRNLIVHNPEGRGKC
ncbi:hypothetical protein GQ43DRAFT_448278 [Delitschia confertaspora ATCC 74209]|uniref:Uncharacterized protein n=1 Tax=Delitschia confertaspora ATCC 74209 TaxID=1513339 RepID=A0A9P4JS33_9PLEO|nr:hypothetical protein GQ43DRAFT_448278 [Delitschia confertaspora ATCC 74209]